MNEISASTGSRFPTVVLVILAVVGIVLGGVGLSSALSGKKAVDELKARMESDLGAAAQLDAAVRDLAGKSQNAFNALNRDIITLRDQWSNSVAKAASPAKAEAGAKKGGKAEQPIDPNGVYHKIKPGDFLGRVAKQYGTTVEAIEKLNPGIDAKHVRLGQKVRVK